MALSLPEPFGLEMGDEELEALVSAGDNNAWSMDDWKWDPKSFTATPTAGAAGRASKRQCMGLSHMGIGGLLETGDACCGNKNEADAGGHSRKQCDAESLGLGMAGSVCNSPKQDSGGSATSQLEGLRGQTACCQVEGCGKDLTGLSTYHQRCRICEVHIKEPRFMRAGLVQRFCQQCGRCHELDAFQGDRRSCKDQLAKHNARRRRRQKKDGPESAPEASTQTPASATPCQAGLISALATLGSWLDQAQKSNPTPFAPQPSLDYQPQQRPWGDASSGGRGVGVPVSQASGVVLGQPAEAHGASAGQIGSVAYPPIMGPQENGASGFAMEDFGAMKYGQAPPHGWEEQTPGADLSSRDLPTASSGMGLKGGALSVEQNEGSFDTALAMMGGGVDPIPPAPYQSENLVVRLSIKLFNCTPAQLPQDLKHQLTSWLNCTPVGAEGYLRPGCVHLVMQAVVTADQAHQIDARGVRAVVDHLASQRHPVWRNHVHLLELNGQVAVVKDGRLLSLVDLSAADSSALAPMVAVAAPALQAAASEGVAGAAPADGRDRPSLRPNLAAVHPAVVSVDDMGARVKLQLVGTEGSFADCKVLCRAEGSYVKTECTAMDGQSGWEVELPEGLQPGLVWLEVQRGSLLSTPHHVLLCPSHALAVELAAAGGGGLTMDVGLILGARRPANLAAIRPLASRLASHACKADMPELLSLLLCIFPHIHLASAPGAIPLQHACVQHSSLAALQILLTAPRVQANPPGPKGITPLHLAALQPEGSRAALALLQHCPPEEWTHCLTDDGLSPSDFARKAGNHTLDREMSTRIAPASLPKAFLRAESEGCGSADPEVAKFGTSPTTSGSSKESGFCLERELFEKGKAGARVENECVPGPNTVSDSETGGSDSDCELWPMC